MNEATVEIGKRKDDAATASANAGTDKKRTKRTRVPLYPSKLPLVGHLFRAWKDPIGLFREALAAQPGAVRVDFGPFSYVMIGSHDSIKHVLLDNAKAYVKSRNYDGLKIVFGQGLLTSEGEFWKRQRRLVQPSFHRQKLAKLTTSMAEVTRRTLDRWKVEGTPTTVHDTMMRLTFAIVGMALFSTDVEGEASAIGNALTIGLTWTNDYAEAVVRIPRWVPTKKNREFAAALRTLDELVFRIIRARRAEKEPGDDLLGMLMAATDESGEERMNDRQIRDEALTMVVAGHETTASLLAFAFYLLAENPEWQDQLVEEAESALAGKDPGFEDIPKLVKTRAVIEETLRLFPPAWAFERQATEEDTIAEGTITKGAIIGVCTYLLHRDPTYFPNPEVFDPTRFYPGAGERHKFAYLPFGGGPRTCIGNTFALTEAILALSMMIREVRAELVPGKKLELDPRVTLRPAGDVPVRLLPRAARVEAEGHAPRSAPTSIAARAAVRGGGLTRRSP